MSREQRLKAFAKLVRHVYGALSALYELFTGEPAPGMQEVMRG